MRYSRKSAGILSLLLLFNSIGMTACGRGVTEANLESIDMNIAENTPTISDITPNILVDQQGYAAAGEKQAVVKGHEPLDTFRLVDRETGDVVFEGSIEQTEYNEDLGLYIGTADFTEYTGEGEFCLECDSVGRSYAFSIKKDHYRELLQALCEEAGDSCRSRSITEEEIITLLEAFEWYPEVFADDENEIPDLLESVADWLEKTANDTEKPEPETMCYVAVMAKFSYLYQQYDARYASQCLQQASAVYEKLVTNSDRDAERFLALTELYRATGLYTYRKQILEYKDDFGGNTDYLEKPGYLYGSMTYLSTRQSVDMELCTVLMENIREQGEELAKRAHNMMDAVTKADHGTEDLLRQAEELSCANYVLYSYQYTELLKDFLHYLMGRNGDSVNYYSKKGDTADYLFLIAQQVSLADND